MDNTKAEVLDFIEKCEQLRKSKFIMATTRIKDVLKSIVNSAALYEVFHAVTNNFDYISAKRKYLVTMHEGLLNKSRLALPDSPADKLAFIFCLLVEFDHDTINFNEFLQQFFPEDGSYYSSFHTFCDKVIVDFERTIIDLFRDELEGVKTEAQTDAGQRTAPNPAVAEKLSAVAMLIAREKNLIACSAMTQSDKQDGISMLEELDSAIREGRANAVDAILRGYEYYSACHNNFSQLINLLSEAMEG